MTARIFWWVEFEQCDELLFERRFALRLKGAVYKNYKRPALLRRSDALYLKENDI